jgi:hypothetical protein
MLGAALEMPLQGGAGELKSAPIPFDFLQNFSGGVISMLQRPAGISQALECCFVFMPSSEAFRTSHTPLSTGLVGIESDVVNLILA